MEEYNDKDKYNNENINKKYNRFNDPTAAGFWTGSIVILFYDFILKILKILQKMAYFLL